MKIIRVAGIAIAILVVIVIALPFVIDVNQFRPQIESGLSTALGRQVTVGTLKLDFFAGGVSADELTIADDPAFSHGPFLHAKSLNVGVEMWPLILSKKINVTGVSIDQPEIACFENSTGDWNYSNLGARPKGAGVSAAAADAADGTAVKLVSVKDIKVSNGRLTVAKAGPSSKPLILDQVEIDLKDFSPASVMPFSLSARLAGEGKLKLEGTAGPIREGSLAATPFHATLNVDHLDLTKAGAAEGVTGLGGLLAIRGRADSDGAKLSVNGRVKAERLTLVKGGAPATKPVEVDFAVEHDLATHAGLIRQGDVHIGKAVATLTGTYTPRGDSIAIKANLSGRGMPVGELEGLLPAINVSLPAGASLQGGTAFVKLSVEGPLESVDAYGSLGLNDARIAGFDLGGKLSVIESLAGIQRGPDTEIETFTADVKSSHEQVSVDNIKAIARNIGDLSGGGTVSPVRALDFKMRVALNGYTHATVPFFIHGTCTEPHFEPDLKGLATEQLHNLKDTAGKLLDGIIRKP